MLKFDEQMRLSVNSDTEYIYIKLYLKNNKENLYLKNKHAVAFSCYPHKGETVTQI